MALQVYKRRAPELKTRSLLGMTRLEFAVFRNCQTSPRQVAKLFGVFLTVILLEYSEKAPENSLISPCVWM